MSQVVRLLPLECRAGPANMAADEVLLDAAVSGIASLRFYTWQVPALSLGYFQPESVRATDPRLLSLPYVRRTSGGATLVHDQELTYALGLPAGATWQSRGQSWICRMHGIIAVAITSFGIAAKPVARGTEQKLDDVLCFRHHTEGDLLVDGHKIAGSAQRKQRGALLQHGAILLAQSPSTPVLSGIQELSGKEISPHILAETLEKIFEQQTGWQLSAQTWTDTELSRIGELAQTKYGHESWNCKR